MLLFIRKNITTQVEVDGVRTRFFYHRILAHYMVQYYDRISPLPYMVKYDRLLRNTANNHTMVFFISIWIQKDLISNWILGVGHGGPKGVIGRGCRRRGVKTHTQSWGCPRIPHHLLDFPLRFPKNGGGGVKNLGVGGLGGLLFKIHF